MTLVVLGSIDLQKFFIDINMPGVRAETSRLAIGVNQGDASVIAQAVQAAVAPSAGQQALQAREGVPSLGVPGIDMGFMTTLRTYMESQATVNGAVGGMALKVMDVVKTQEAQATTMSQVQAAQAQVQAAQAQVQAAQARQETEQARQETEQARQETAQARVQAVQARQEADLAQMQVEMQALRTARVAASALPAPVAIVATAVPVVPLVSMQKNKKIPPETKVLVYQWLIGHIKHPYPNHTELEELRVQCDIESTVRMQNLVVATRHKCLVKGEKRRVGTYMRTSWSLPEKNWVQTDIGRWLRE